MNRLIAWLNRRPGLYGPAALICLLGLVLLFFNRMAFSNLILARGDTFLYFYPYWEAAAGALRAGRIPLWNPDIFMGAPFLANSQAGLFYPLNWPVWLVLPAPYAVSASIVAHVTIAGFGAYLAGRRTLALERPAALLGAALFALGGYLTAQVEHVNQFQGLAWLPWLFAAVAPLVGEASGEKQPRLHLKVVLAVGVIFALQLLAGHTQTAFISGVSVGLWLTTWALQDLCGLPRPGRPETRRRLGRWLPAAAVIFAGVVLAAVLSAVQLLPTLELTGLSSRQGGLPLNEVLSFSWHPLHLTRAVLPSYGQALFSEYVAFFPLTGLVLALAGSWRWRHEPRVRPWVILIAIALLLAFGRFTPVYYLIGNLPGFELFRVPARWLAVAALGTALMAGVGWQRVADFANREWASEAERAEARRALVRPLAAAGVVLAMLVIWGFAAGYISRFLPSGLEAPYEPPGLPSLLGWLIEGSLLALFLWVALTAPRERARRIPVDLAILALAALWLGSRGLPYNQLTTPEAYFDMRPPTARLLAIAGCLAPGPCENPPGRFLSLSEIFFDPGDAAEIDSIYADQLSTAAIYDYLVAVKHKEVLSPNLSLVYGLPAIDGFDGGILPLAAYGELMRLILPEGTGTTDGRLREFLTATPDSRWLSLFNGRFLITDKTGDIWREGVFFDRQHPVRVSDEPATVDDPPVFEATELWLLSDGTPPPVEIVTTEGASWRLDPQVLAPPDVYQVPFPRPATVAAVTLSPCEDQATDCGFTALTLVDAGDNTFQPLTPAPYRLIYSGDVKIYENRDSMPRAFMVPQWGWLPDAAESVAAMAEPGFDPRQSAVLIGEEEATAEPPDDWSGTVDITSYEPERVVMQADGDGGLLILTDAYYPGWEATVDGDPAPIYQANGLFRGVIVPAGLHEIVFHFRPRSFQIGSMASLMGLVIILVGMFTIARVRSRSRH